MWDPLLNHRTAGNKEHLQELGTATIAVIVTSAIAERALKSLIAQTQPNVKPPSGRDGHDLRMLFGKLYPQVQQQLKTHLETMPDIWAQYWEGDNIEEVFRIADTNFVDWRYTMEPKAVSGAIPKGVLKAAVAVKTVCWAYLKIWQIQQ